MKKIFFEHLHEVSDFSGELIKEVKELQVGGLEAPYWLAEVKKKVIIWSLASDKVTYPVKKQFLKCAKKITPGDLVSVWDQDKQSYKGQAKVIKITKAEKAELYNGVPTDVVQLQVLKGFDYYSYYDKEGHLIESLDDVRALIGYSDDDKDPCYAKNYHLKF